MVRSGLRPHYSTVRTVKRPFCSDYFAPEASGVPRRFFDISEAQSVRRNVRLWTRVRRLQWRKELCNAATKIQASFRGHQARKQTTEVKDKQQQDQVCRPRTYRRCQNARCCPGWRRKFYKSYKKKSEKRSTLDAFANTSRFDIR
ncbi:hypothetical protein EVAR_30306_1 [Eumeta japonica]|uniref:Uncharacterized protein n=1 Tax=Eumeta variegata TaxID=151549 RepID=A0A4C1WAR4_EUMVA|nr:hypothetical protein EVAR_30306_1 [Eumeta japonica]